MTYSLCIAGAPESIHWSASPQMLWGRKKYSFLFFFIIFILFSYYLSCQIASAAVGGASSFQITVVKEFHVPLLHSVEISATWVIDTRCGADPWRPGHCPHQNTSISEQFIPSGIESLSLLHSICSREYYMEYIFTGIPFPLTLDKNCLQRLKACVFFPIVLSMSGSLASDTSLASLLSHRTLLAPLSHQHIQTVIYSWTTAEIFLCHPELTLPSDSLDNGSEKSTLWWFCFIIFTLLALDCFC